MILFSVGLPSRFAERCDAVTLRLAERGLGAVSAAVVNTLDEVAQAAIRTDAAHLVAISRQPVVRLQTEIIQSGRPFLVTLSAVHLALYELLQRPGYDLALATREVAGSCAALLTLAAAPGALVLSSCVNGDVTALATAIARHFGFLLSPGDVAAVARSVGAAAVPDERDESAWLDQLSAREHAIINGALEPYVKYFNGKYFNGGGLEPIVWEPELFYTNESAADGSYRPASGPIDITGRARFLIFGPYINLPPGAWSATAVIGFSAETAGLSFVIEVTAGQPLTHARVEPTGEQVIEIDLQFSITDTIVQPVEIRVMSERAALDGRIVLGNVRLVPRTNVQSEVERKVIEELRG